MSLRNPSLFQNLWDIEDFMLRGGHRDFPLVLFGLSVLENFVGNPFNLPETFGFRNMHENGKSRSSVENFCLTIREKFPGTTSNIQNFWDIGNFHAHHGFLRCFFVSQYRKTS